MIVMMAVLDEDETSASLGLFGFQTILEIRRKAILCGRHSCE